jgi:hypothetical protein
VSIPVAVRSMLAEAAAGWTDEVLVPWTGDLSIERSIAGHRYHSADVGLWPAALAGALLDESIEVDVDERAEPYWGWLREWLTTPLDRAATVLLVRERVVAWPKKGEPTRFHRGVLDAIQRRWQGLHGSAVQRLQALAIPIASYHTADPLAWLSERPGLPVMACLPIADPYSESPREETILRWAAPEAVKLDDHLDDLVAALLDRDAFAVGLRLPLPALEPYRIGRHQTASTGVPIHVYARGHARLTRPRQTVEPVTIPRLGPDETPAEPITLRALSTAEFAGLRSRYLNPHIPPSSPRLAVAVLAAGKLVGCYAVEDFGGPRQSNAALVPEPAAFLLSDFPVAPAVRKLAKLVLYAALSRESQLLIESRMHHRIRALFTTAYSDRPVSQKYRGLFDLVGRKERDPGSHTHYALNYSARLGQWPIADALALWEK